MWTPPTNESAELTQGTLSLIHYSEEMEMLQLIAEFTLSNTSDFR